MKEVIMNMKVVSIFNQKGGVGKTTTNINLSSFLALNGYRVLTIDVDPQGNSTSGFGIDKKSIKNSFYDVISTDMDIKDAIIHSETMDNLHIIPSSLELAAAEVELINRYSRESILKNKITSIENDYDYVFIDCPPSLGFLSINALSASNSVMIPIQCEFYALEGVGQLINTIQLIKKSLNNNLYVEGVIMTMYDSRNNLCNDVIKEVKEYFKDVVYDTKIPRNIRLAEAPSYGLPIMMYDEKCKGSECYEQLAREFIRRQEEK